MPQANQMFLATMKKHQEMQESKNKELEDKMKAEQEKINEEKRKADEERDRERALKELLKEEERAKSKNENNLKQRKKSK
jgi:hypothetical protein